MACLNIPIKEQATECLHVPNRIASWVLHLIDPPQECEKGKLVLGIAYDKKGMEYIRGMFWAKENSGHVVLTNARTQ